MNQTTIKMTPSELKYRVEKAGHDRFFFTRDTMRFFGDTMANYGVRSTTVTIDEWVNDKPTGRVITVEAWELWRKRPVKHGMRDSTFFDKTTYARVFPKGADNA